MKPDQILSILMFLQAFNVDPTTISNVQAILQRSATTTTTQTMNEIVNDPTPASQPDLGPTPVGSVGAAPQQSDASIEIVSPLSGKGVRYNLSTQAVFDERGNPRNQIDIGAIVRDTDGQPTNSADVVVSVTVPGKDTAETTTLHGTGNVMPIYPNGQKQMVSYYPFHYEFTVAGTYVIKFSALNLDQQVTLQVSN